MRGVLSKHIINSMRRQNISLDIQAQIEHKNDIERQTCNLQTLNL